MLTQNRFLQGVYPFDGAGLDKPVADQRRAQPTSCRTG